MMEEDDPRVKILQDLAWSLQNFSNKPGCRLPEAYKREIYKVTSRAISLCSNAPYVEESDFLERAAALTTEIEAKKSEMKEVEDREIKKLEGKCFRPAEGGGGSYTVSGRMGRGTGKASDATEPDWDTLANLPTTAGSAPSRGFALTAQEVAARCEEDPEALWLGSLGLSDSDVAELCEGLRRAGAGVRTLDLSHNALAEAGVQRLVTALAAGACPRLEELWLDGNSFGPLGEEILRSGLSALRKGLRVHIKEEGLPRPAPPQEPDAAGEAASVAEASHTGLTGLD